MNTLEKIRTRLIDRIMLTENEKLLVAMEKILNTSMQNDKLELTAEQIELLLLSEKDISNGNLISEEELEILDEEWMKNQ